MKSCCRDVAICKSYGSKRNRRQVLFDVDIEVRSGECLAIIGASGSGKSTLTRVLFGLGSADCGEIAYRGQAMGERNDAVRHMLRGETGLVFQDPFASLDPRWRVARSVEEPLRLHHRGMGDDEAAARIGRALRLVGLDRRYSPHGTPWIYPAGRRNVSPCTCLVDDPGVILADEPMSAIDVAARVRILETFHAIREANPNMSLVMVSHDLGVVQHIADRIVVLHDGHVEESGTTTEILNHPCSAYTRSLIEAASM